MEESYGEHLVDELEDGLPVLVLELLEKPGLFGGLFVPGDDLGWDVPLKVRAEEGKGNIGQHRKYVGPYIGSAGDVP